MKTDRLTLVIAVGLVLTTGGFWTPAKPAEAEKDQAAGAVRPSNLIFLPEIEEMTGGEEIEIKFTAKAEKVQLWIDDEKIADADSPTSFKWRLPSRDKAYKVEIKKDGKVLLGRYIPKKHPYFFFQNVKQSPAYRYRDQSPYREWIRDLEARAEEPINAAILYQLTGDAAHVETAKKALLEFPLLPEKAEWNGYGNYRNLGYGLNKNYAIMYDLIASSLTPRERNEIEDRLVQSGQRMANWIKEPLRFDIGGQCVLASNLAVTACSILGYHGSHQDQGNAYLLLGDAVNYLFASSPGAKYYAHTKGFPAMRWSGNSDGHETEGGYRHYFSGDFAPFPVICMNSVGTNLAAEYHTLHGHFLDIVGIACPDGRYPNIVTSWGGIWWDLLSAPPLYKGEQQKAVQWYCNQLWEWEKLGAWGHRGWTRHVTWGFTYDKDTPAAPPTFDGDPTYFTHESGSAVFRSGRDKDDLYLYFKADHEHGLGGHYGPHQLSYDMWAKRAYLAIDSGNPRWIVMYTGGHNTFEIDNAAITKGGRAFTYNKSYLENHFATPFLDYGEGRMEVTRALPLPAERGDRDKPLPDPVLIRRAILFPENEYFVVLDRLQSKAQHEYKMLLHLGGSEIAAGTEFETVADRETATGNTIKGTLKIEGEEVAWGGKEYRSRNKVGRVYALPRPTPVEHTFDDVQNVSWTTQSVTPAHPESFEVELKAFIVPTCSADQRMNVAHLGNYGPEGDYWAPVLDFKQSGANVKYLNVVYPRKVSGDPDPKIEELKVNGGSAEDDYAVKLSREGVQDIVTIADGERISVDNITTDGRISYCRREQGTLTTVMFSYGKTFAANEGVLASSEDELKHLALKFEPKRTTGHIGADKPTKVRILCSFEPARIDWKKDRPNWMSPSTDSEVYEPKSLPFQREGEAISFQTPKGSATIVVESK